MFVKITSLATLPEYVLLVGFSTGEFKQFDVKPLIKKYPAFKSFTQVVGLFEQAKIDVGGYGVVWNDDLDLSADGLYEQGTACSQSEDVESFKQKLISALVTARKSAKLSQKQLEVLSGVAQPCIARMESGATDPQLSTLLKLLEPLGLTLSITSL